MLQAEATRIQAFSYSEGRVQSGKDKEFGFRTGAAGGLCAPLASVKVGFAAVGSPPRASCGFEGTGRVCRRQPPQPSSGKGILVTGTFGGAFPGRPWLPGGWEGLGVSLQPWRLT